MKLIFSRFGGKKTKSAEIIREFKEHRVYVEAFLGSGAIFFEKEKSVISVLNDLDPAIYNIFEGAKTHSQSFDEKEWSWIPDRQKWDLFRKNIEQDLLSDPLEKIYQSLYFIRHSWSGLGQSFTPTRWKNNETYKIKLGDYKEKLTNTIISKQDYKAVIERFDSPNTLFYLDPPYEIAITKKYYEYQKDLISKALLLGRATITAPKGSGKTLIMAGLVKSLKNKKMVILFNTKQLLKQTYDFLKDVCKIDNLGLCFGEGYIYGDIMLCTVQSIEKILDTHLILLSIFVIRPA